MKTSRFILQNIALRAMGLTKVPPYWLVRENNFHGINTGYLGGKTIEDSSEFDVEDLSDADLKKWSALMPLAFLWLCLCVSSWKSPVPRNGCFLLSR